MADKTQGQGKGNTPATPAASGTDGAAKKRERSTPAEARTKLVARVKDSVRKAVVSLQSAEMRRTGTLSGNADLVKAYESFVGELDKLATIPAGNAPAAPAQS